jgi:hypothetical protein
MMVRTPRKIEAHKRLWSIVIFHGKERGLIGLYATKALADDAVKRVKGGFVLPPREAWKGTEAHA